MLRGKTEHRARCPTVIGANNVIAELREKAAKVEGTMGGLAAATFRPTVERSCPFQGRIKKREMRDLKVGIIGRDEISAGVARTLSRSGIGGLVLCESTTSAEKASTQWPNNKASSMDAPSFHGVKDNKEVGCDVSHVKLDLRLPQDITVFEEEMSVCDLMLLCSDSECEKAAVKELSAGLDMPWIEVDIDRKSASFWFQWYLEGIRRVSDVDMISAPIIDEVNHKVGPELRMGVEAIFVSACGGFSGMVTASVLQYWKGNPAAFGYLWYCPLFDQFSSALLADLDSD